MSAVTRRVCVCRFAVFSCVEEVQNHAEPPIRKEGSLALSPEAFHSRWLSAHGDESCSTSCQSSSTNLHEMFTFRRQDLSHTPAPLKHVHLSVRVIYFTHFNFIFFYTQAEKLRPLIFFNLTVWRFFKAEARDEPDSFGILLKNQISQSDGVKLKIQSCV